MKGNAPIPIFFFGKKIYLYYVLYIVRRKNKYISNKSTNENKNPFYLKAFVCYILCVLNQDKSSEFWLILNSKTNDGLSGKIFGKQKHRITVSVVNEIKNSMVLFLFANNF